MPGREAGSLPGASRGAAVDLVIEPNRASSRRSSAQGGATRRPPSPGFASRAETGSGLLALDGIGPSGAARLLGDIGDVSRFRPGSLSDRTARPAAWSREPVGTSGRRVRHQRGTGA